MRPRTLLLLALPLCAVIYAAALAQRRGALQLGQHLRRVIPLPFSPLGPPALHRDGRMYLVTAGDQLLALEEGGQLAWNKRLPGAVTPRPVLAGSDLLVLQGQGRLHGYSLGGDPRFVIEDGGAVGDLPCADGRGRIFLLDDRGRLRGFEPSGSPQFQTSLGLSQRRRVLALPDGRILAAGSPDGLRGAVAIAEATGVVVLRHALPTPPVGLSPSPRRGELVSIASGTEVRVLGARGEILRRVDLPGPVLGDPLLLPSGAIYAYVRRQGALDLCLAGGGCTELFEEAPPMDLLPAGPLLSGQGLVVAPFCAPGRILPGYQGVLSLSLEGRLSRQPLPVAMGLTGLVLEPGGAVLASSPEERYLWELF